MHVNEINADACIILLYLYTYVHYPHCTEVTNRKILISYQKREKGGRGTNKKETKFTYYKIANNSQPKKIVLY